MLLDGAQGVLPRRALPGAGLRPDRPVPRRLLPRRRPLRSARVAGGARGLHRRGRRAVPALRHHGGRGLAAAAARTDAPPRDRRQRRAHRGRAPHRGPRGPQPDGRQAPGQGRRAALGGHPAAVRRAGRAPNCFSSPGAQPAPRLSRRPPNCATGGLRRLRCTSPRSGRWTRASFSGRCGPRRRVVFVEGNATGQFERLLRRETGFEGAGNVRRFDGLPITPGYILRALAAAGIAQGAGR